MNVSKAVVMFRAAMEEQNVTYQEVGDAIGVSKMHAWRMLTGVKTLQAKYMDGIAELLGLDMNEVVEPEPVIQVRMPERFQDWLQARAVDTGVDVDTLIVNAVAAWIKGDVNAVKLQSHENTKAIKAVKKRNRAHKQK